MSTTDNFARVGAAAIDERQFTVYNRQIEHEKLSKAILANINRIREAIASDYDHSDAEISVELWLVMDALRKDYATLQAKKALKEEYLVARGKDAPAARRPVGIVYVEPCAHTLFYSVVVPVSAAIAAGNCVIVLLENTLRSVPSLLREILSTALDREIFGIASSPVKDQSLLDRCIIVDQNRTLRWPASNILASPATRKTIAVVDRTGDVKQAAKELSAARFSFGGSSPYAPDVVFVNEFVKDELVRALEMELSASGKSHAASNGNIKSGHKASNKLEGEIEALQKSYVNVRTLHQGMKHAIVEVQHLGHQNTIRKSATPVLLLHPIRSLDDAIDLINISNPDSEPALATYFFSDAKSAKYLNQFIASSISFINHIPREWLVGPAFPSSLPIGPTVRYPLHLFTVPKPAFVTPSNTSKMLAAALTSDAGSSAATQKLLLEATAPLKLMKRHPGGGVGFFEQGFLLNAALILTTTLSATGVGVYYLLKLGRSFW